MTAARPVATRFAPSPTGFLHVGGARTALYAWLYARQQGGRFVLRIEDTDREREVPGAIAHIIESLQWLGVDWDEGVDKGGPYGPYLQSERLAIYRKYAQQLVASGNAYADPYTAGEVEQFRQEAQANSEPFLFRNYRPENPPQWDGSQPLRFKTTNPRRYEWEDHVRGTLSAGPEALDDFILIKSDGFPTYSFAHIVDDIEMGITHVMRGEEFISSTPRFLSVYEALGVTPPQFVTMPPIMGPDGKKKLSKRDGARDILSYRDEGFMPVAVRNYLALLGWNPGTEQEFFSAEKLTAAFSLERIQPSGARFDETKLLFINQHWMRTLSDTEFVAAMQPHVPRDRTYDPDRLAHTLPLLRERAQTFAQAGTMLAHELLFLFERPLVTPEDVCKKESTPELRGVARAYLQAARTLLADTHEKPADAETLKALLMPPADEQEAQHKGGRGAGLWALRYGLSGQERSPDPFTIIAIIGKEEAVARITEILSLMEGACV